MLGPIAIAVIITLVISIPVTAVVASNRKMSEIEGKIGSAEDKAREIIANQSHEKSKALWMRLLGIVEKYRAQLDRLVSGKCNYFYRTYKAISFEPSDIVRLKTESWIVKKDGTFASAAELDIESMSEMYLVDGDDAKSVLDVLRISSENVLERDIDDTLSEEQKRKIALANQMDALGVTEEEFLEWIAQKAKSKGRSEGEDTAGSESGQNEDKKTSNGSSVSSPITEQDDNWEASPEVKSVVKEITSRPKAPPKPVRETENADEDEYTLPALDYSEQIEKAKEKSALEIEKIVHLEQLQRQIEESEKYSFGWFRALMELEAISHGASESGSKEISISFANVEKEAGSERTLILKHPLSPLGTLRLQSL